MRCTAATKWMCSTLLADLAYRTGLGLRVEDEHPRLWLAERTPAAYPTVEEFYVAAPGQVRDKARPAFLSRWSEHASRSLALQEARVTPSDSWRFPELSGG